MKRFIAVLVVIAVAGATYVAAAPGGRKAVPTAKQFIVLKRQVAALKKKLKLQGSKINTLSTQVAAQATTVAAVQTTANANASFIATCLKAGGASGIRQFGDGTTTGYVYTNDGGNTYVLTSAIDFDSTSPQEYVQGVASSCVTSGGAAPTNGAPSEHRHAFSAAKH